MPRPQSITRDEINAAFEDEAMRAAYPPILTPEQFAGLFSVSVSTAYDWIAKGYFDGATTHVGKHLRIWRSRAIEIAFSRQRTKPRRNTCTTQPQNPPTAPASATE
jgi:hypothetical protein